MIVSFCLALWDFHQNRKEQEKPRNLLRFWAVNRQKGKPEKTNVPLCPPGPGPRGGKGSNEVTWLWLTLKIWKQKSFSFQCNLDSVSRFYEGCDVWEFWTKGFVNPKIFCWVFWDLFFVTKNNKTCIWLVIIFCTATWMKTWNLPKEKKTSVRKTIAKFFL